MATIWTRRHLLHRGLLCSGLVGLGLTAAAANHYRSKRHPDRVTPLPETLTTPESRSAFTALREFDYGILTQAEGRTVREFHLTAETTPVQLNSVLSYVTWNYNGRVPGPTLRAKAGERIRVVFHNQAGHSHSVHFHGIHPSSMDGIRPVPHDATEVYEFDAEPFGVHPYHCHVAPVTRHIGKGLYGLLIVDPPHGRPAADELVLVMGGYDLDEDGQNDLYAFNGIPDVYMQHPIPIQQDQRIRVYLLNMVEGDAALTFHLHANFFQVYPLGRTLSPRWEADVVTLGTTERHILEFSYHFPGLYMFHPHQDQVAEKGCMGAFQVF